jgi:hypothetical protein
VSWNYRLIDHGTHLSVREVYYDDGGKPKWWMERPCEVSGESVDDIEDDLKLILKDLRRFPPIPESELPE